MISASRNRNRSAGFTLVELMVSMSILSLILLVLISITGQTSKTWRYTTGKIEEFRESRTAYETITSRLRQATLNTYWDYDNPTLPTRYERRSELRFISGSADTLLGAGPNGETRLTHAVFFHAPLGLVDTTNTTYRGLENLLNVWGYYVEFNSDRTFRPTLVNAVVPKVPERYRFRLMEFRQQSEQLATYNYTSGTSPTGIASITYKGNNWFQPAANDGTTSKPMSDNIIALILIPRLSKLDEAALKASSSTGSSGSIPASPDYSPLAPSYAYDSTAIASTPELNPKNQLPPIIQVTMVAVDENTAVRLRFDSNSKDIFNLKTKFTDTASYSLDLLLNTSPNASSLENTLIALKANYRIFSSTVPIRAAKWSRQQKN